MNLNQATTAHIDQAHTARGFVLIHVERHSMLYGLAVKLFQEKIKRAEELARDIPDILGRLKDVEAASGAWRVRIGDPMIAFGKDPKTYEKAIEVARLPEASTLQAAFRDKFEAAQAKLTAMTAQAGETAANKIWHSRLLHTGSSIAAIVIAILMGVLLARSTEVPVRRLTAIMRRLVGGDHHVEVAYVERTDEIGQMAGAVLNFRTAAIEKLRIEQETESMRREVEAFRSANDAERQLSMQAAQSACEALTTALETMAQGDFTYTIDFPLTGELDRLRVAFNTSIMRLRQAIRSVSEETGTIGGSIEQVAVASEDLSRRTETQAASLEEAAAAIHQAAVTVRKTADGAAHAREIVSKTMLDVKRGGEVVHQAILAMGQIEKASQKINGFIGIIDEIAFQTSLLALNAGVEAARAGEAGRGFAVVAAEVRSLASRSATTAQQVNDLVSFSAKSIGDGVALVGEAGSTLTRITSEIDTIGSVVSDIATGTREQAAGLDQLNAAVREIDDSTQQNAAMAEQTMAAIESVAAETRDLVRLISQFTISDGSEHRTARAA